MSDTVISVENLSKLYLLGQAERKHESLVSELGGLLSAPFRNYRKLRRLDTSQVTAHQADSPDFLWALKDVSFEVKRGEVLGVIGRNGAGKSTLLKILSQITEPTKGRVRMRGRVASLLEVGTGFHPELTGRENIYLNGTILGMKRREIDRKFDEIVDFSGVERFLDTPVKRYSSGMKVRLGFAVAAHLLPDILIVDEVLAVGDMEFQTKCLGKMEEVAHEGGRTILFVSHSMNSINRLCERVILMNNGGVQLDSTTVEATQAYLGLNAPGGQQVGEQRFEVQPERQAQFLGISVVSADGVPCSQLNCDDPFKIRIEIDVRSPIKETYFGILMLNSESVRVLFSDSRDVSPNPGAALPVGRHHIELAVPGRVLAPGSYSINIGWSNSLGGQLDHRSACCRFTLVELSSHRASRPGVLSLRLPWAHYGVSQSLESVGAGIQ
jgi:lipopolysaccharide transport system ATP-binding protein